MAPGDEQFPAKFLKLKQSRVESGSQIFVDDGVVSMSLPCIPNLSLDEEDATAGVEVR